MKIQDIQKKKTQQMVQAVKQLEAEGTTVTTDSVLDRFKTITAKEPVTNEVYSPPVQIDPGALTFAQGVELTKPKPGREGVVIPPPPPPPPNSDPYPTDDEYPGGGMAGGDEYVVGDTVFKNGYPQRKTKDDGGLNKKFALIPGIPEQPIWVYFLVAALIFLAWKYGTPKN